MKSYNTNAPFKITKTLYFKSVNLTIILSDAIALRIVQLTQDTSSIFNLYLDRLYVLRLFYWDRETYGPGKYVTSQ